MMLLGSTLLLLNLSLSSAAASTCSVFAPSDRFILWCHDDESGLLLSSSVFNQKNNTHMARNRPPSIQVLRELHRKNLHNPGLLARTRIVRQVLD